MYRPEIGITAFLNQSEDYQPLSCIFKHYRSDFVVQEILEDQKVCEITDTEQVHIVSEDEAENESNVGAPAKFTEEMQKQLTEFRANKESKLLVDVEDWTKDERRLLHVYVRSLGGLDSSTENNKITITRLSRERKRKPGVSREKKYVHFTMSKEGHDTSYSLNLITKMLNKSSNTIGFCGTKDRRAITSQRVSVYAGDPSRLYDLNSRLRGIVLSDAEYQSKELALGMAYGNRFSIALREFDSKDNDEVIEARISEWEKDGFLNYFGDQRFGSWDNSTAAVGQKILQRDWQGAVEMILSPISGYESQLNAALTKYRDSKDAKDALSLVPGGLKFTSNEGKMLKSLSTRSTDFKGALMSIPRASRSLYVHGYQSLVFNKIESKRADKYGKQVIEGDLFMIGDKFVEAGSIDDVVLPLVCFPSRYPDNEIKEWYTEILIEDGISKEVFLELKGDFGLGESMRKFIEKPLNVSHRLVWYKDPNTVLQNFPPFSKTNDEELFDKPTDGARKALLIKFDLRSGIYATMSLRELLRFDLGRTNQKEMSSSQSKTNNGKIEAKSDEEN